MVADRVPVVVADRMRYWVSAGVLAIVVAACISQHRSTPPMPTDWATDLTGMLPTKAKASLDLKLKEYERTTGHQVIVWISDSTHGEPHSDFAIRAANAWGVGRQGKDDGVVLFVFTKDDMRWIWVGYGLEQAIPDKEASRICREIIAPKVRAGNLEGGIQDGIGAILWDIDGWEKR